jgi:hypothetical protein
VKKASRLRLVVASAALVAVSVAGAGGPASANPASKAQAPTVKTIAIKGQQGETLRFEGPRTIAQDATLRIRNKTNPADFGPHTFSLVKRSEIPKTRKQIGKCFDFKLICGSIASWHLVDFSTEPPTVGQPLSDVNEVGWDTPGDRQTRGDSWVTDTQGQTLALPASSEPRTLRFICAVHPFMRGKIEVTPGPTQ